MAAAIHLWATVAIHWVHCGRQRDPGLPRVMPLFALSGFEPGKILRQQPPQSVGQLDEPRSLIS